MRSKASEIRKRCLSTHGLRRFLSGPFAFTRFPPEKSRQNSSLNTRRALEKLSDFFGWWGKLVRYIHPRAMMRYGVSNTVQMKDHVAQIRWGATSVCQLFVRI